MLSISEVNSAIMTQVWTDVELRSMIVSILGLATMYCGLLALRVLDSRDI